VTSIALTIVGMLVCAYVGVALILYFMQPKFVYEPIKELPFSPAELGLDFENVAFRTADRLRLHGWFIPANNNSEFTVLYCHGNGGNMMYFLDTVNFLNSLGLNCFIFDYRGYGSSQGRPSEDGTYFDVRAAYRWLTKTRGIPHSSVIIFGWSLGGAVAAYLATKVRARALVIEGAFTSYADIGAKYYPYMPVRWAARFRYPTVDYVRKAKCPVLIIHSRDDETVPFEFGLRLYDAANDPKEFVELRGPHNDAFLFSAETYKKAWLKWLASLKENSADDSSQQQKYV
jgi:fermentation-respiration switch protein FrsA (DUF1100 family)